MRPFPAHVSAILVLSVLTFSAQLVAQPTVSLMTDDGLADEAGQDPASFTVETDMAPGFNLRVYLQLGGTASTSADYDKTNLVGAGGDSYYVTIPSAGTPVTATLTPRRDNLIEDEETITFDFLPPQMMGHDYIIGDPSGGNAILADDVAEVSLMVDDPEAFEAGQDPASFTVSRTAQGDTSAAMRVYLEMGGTATGLQDYDRTNLTGAGGDTVYIRLPGGQLSETATLTPRRDNLIEGQETITFTLIGHQFPNHEYVVGAPNTGNATLDDDVAQISITAPDPLAHEEGEESATVVVSRSDQGNTDSNMRVYLELGGSAIRNTDFTTTGLTGAGGNSFYTTLAGGSLSQEVIVTPIFDLEEEGDESVTFMLLGHQFPNHEYQIGLPSETEVTIVDFIEPLIDDGFEDLQ